MIVIQLLVRPLLEAGRPGQKIILKLILYNKFQTYICIHFITQNLKVGAIKFRAVPSISVISANLINKFVIYVP
jgi:hypothetical protein